MGKTEKFDNIDLIAAKFQQNPFEFKRQFMTRPEPSLTRTERNDELEKLYDEIGILGQQHNSYIGEQQDTHKKIIECAEKIIALKPDDSYAWQCKGFSLSCLSKDEEAIECYDKATELDPKDADTWGNKGITLQKLGRNDEAEECFDKEREHKDNG